MQLEEDLENVLASLPPAESAADAQESRPSSAMDEDRGDGPNGRGRRAIPLAHDHGR